MKPQKKAVISRKAIKMPTVAKKRRSILEKIMSDVQKDKKVKKLDKIEDKKKSEKMDKKKEKVDKLEEKKKCLKDPDRKIDKTEDKKLMDVDEESKSLAESLDKKKLDKQLEGKKKRLDEEDVENSTLMTTTTTTTTTFINCIEEKVTSEEKIQILVGGSPGIKKKCKEEKKKDQNVKEATKVVNVKEKKGKEVKTKVPIIKSKRDPKLKESRKKSILKRTTSSKTQFPVVKKLLDKKVKLIKSCKDADETVKNGDNESMKRVKKKSPTIGKNKNVPEKKVKLAKQMKAKLPPKNSKITAALKRKIINKKKLDQKDNEKIQPKGSTTNQDLDTSSVKSEDVSEGFKKSLKNSSKVCKKLTRKTTKGVKVQIESNNQKTLTSDDEVCQDEPNEGSKNCEEEDDEFKRDAVDSVDVDLKIEPSNVVDHDSKSHSESDKETDSTESWETSSKSKDNKRKDSSSSADERARRMRLFGFWSGPKQYRVASLNALAKVHCLYENETGGVYLGGFCKPKPEKDKPQAKKTKDDKDDTNTRGNNKEKEIKEKKCEKKTEEIVVSKRKLRKVPGLRGKHWDMVESSSSSSSSSEEESEKEKTTSEPCKKKIIKRKRKNEEVMDLKDMVVCKRMASLNASAILAASYSDEKNNRCSSSSSSSDTSSESDIEIVKGRRKIDLEMEKKRGKRALDSDDIIKPSKKVVIVNQDTDVTITGVYVNQTRSTHHEEFCSIAGMQYRISSTSHTQTAATAVATELRDQQKTEQPCKSYTPLGALSSMQPPGSQGNHPDMSPRRHSAFSAPHQHGYYQPAGPLIQHPSTFPPVKGPPPPDPTPTPPQNSESSDDLVATSTSGIGTNGSGGAFYRTYCPQYYGTPPQYQDLCYPPTYSHSHAHTPHYYKYAPTYRRQYYGYQEVGGGGGPGGGGTGAVPGVVDYTTPTLPPPPPPHPPAPGDYALSPYYGSYPPPPPPPPPNAAYLHSQGRPFVDHAAFQGCPCPMQSCPKNVDTGPLIGNGKGAPVVSGPGLSLPPSALVGPPSPARGLAGLAPPHGSNAWDTDRVQLNTHCNRNKQKSSSPSVPTPTSGIKNSDVRNNKILNSKSVLKKCACRKQNCTSSTCKVKMENLSPNEKLTKYDFKIENNNVKCETCSVEIVSNLSCPTNCNVKCESDYKCDMMKCEQCMKESEMAILEIDKDSGILLIDDKLDEDSADVKEELDDVVAIDTNNWNKPDYESTVLETIEESQKCKKLTKRKLSLDSLSDNQKKRKTGKRTLSVGSSSNDFDRNEKTSIEHLLANRILKTCPVKKKLTKKDVAVQKRNSKDNNITPSNVSILNSAPKKTKNLKSMSNNLINCLRPTASDSSIMETIDDVIQQSLKMTQLEEKERRKKSSNLLASMKRVTKKIELVKNVTSLKLGQIIPKNNQQTRSKEIPKRKLMSKNIKNKSKVLDMKLKSQDLKSPVFKDELKREEKIIDEDNVDLKKVAASIKKRRKSAKKVPMKKSNCELENSSSVANDVSTITKKSFLKPKWSNGWSWEGDSFEAKVYLTNEESALRRCYPSMKHESGDVLRPLDCVLLKSGPRKADLPFVAKIAALWENPDDGEMMFSLLWYYRPEHTEQGRTQYDTEDEVFASRHRDANSVACIEDKCYILTFNEYCRYRKNLKRIEEGLENPGLIVPPGDQMYPRENRQPPIPVPSDMVLFCRRVYDYRGKKLVKNPG